MWTAWTAGTSGIAEVRGQWVEHVWFHVNSIWVDKDVSSNHGSIKEQRLNMKWGKLLPSCGLKPCTILLYSSKSFLTSWDWASVWSYEWNTRWNQNNINRLNIKENGETNTCCLTWICDRRCSLVACSGTSGNIRHIRLVHNTSQTL